MKCNIKSWPFNTTTSTTESRWYAWDEYCDMCGKMIHNTDLQTSKEPDIEEKDYCIDCLRKLIDGKWN